MRTLRFNYKTENTLNVEQRVDATRKLSGIITHVCVRLLPELKIGFDAGDIF